MYLWMFVFTSLLFIVLSPGVLLSLPPGGSKMTIVVVHSVVFSLIYCLTHKMVFNYMYPEGFMGYKMY